MEFWNVSLEEAYLGLYVGPNLTPLVRVPIKGLHTHEQVSGVWHVKRASRTWEQIRREKGSGNERRGEEKRGKKGRRKKKRRGEVKRGEERRGDGRKVGIEKTLERSCIGRSVLCGLVLDRDRHHEKKPSSTNLHSANPAGAHWIVTDT